MAIQEWGFAHLPDTSHATRFPHHDHDLVPASQFHCATCGEEIGRP